MGFEEKDILYEDPSILVCRKRPGMAVQSAGPGQMDLESALKNYLARKNPGKGVPYLGVVQRLDQPVEVVLVFALTKQSGELTDWLKKEGRRSVVVDSAARGGKRARLAYEVLAEKEGKSLLSVRLYTGRYHQIRCQLAHGGMPVAGDILYGSGEARMGAIGLCACRLAFDHPKTGKRMEFAVWPEHNIFAQFGPEGLDTLEVSGKNIYNA